ncbi:hypothetical protein [uncultured Maribacter sp.]|jgi:hypothetical protein|uniref:hypothetical protein n=1 Tax=uncultured Maribacter sp. TaxID=431308 RepID=UPI002629D838|nr:hypothetical protein [uncultured Maribacter sp.]
MKKISILFLIFVIGIIGCSKDENEATTTGDLNVIVVLNGNQPVGNAEVYTNPPSKKGTTDDFGSVLLTDLEKGSYEIFASLENIGTGKSVVNIQTSELSETTINIIPGINEGLAPSIQIILPETYAEFSEGEEITFSADVFDDETSYQDLKIVWESSLDGELNTNSPDMNGNVIFTTNTLSRGTHQITITAEDSDGYSSSASIEISTLSPSAITLLEPIKNEGKVLLEWTEYSNSDFLKYEIYRTDGNCSEQNQILVGTVSEKGTLNFTDEFPPLEFQVCYFIKVTNNVNNSRKSNQETVDTPSGHIFNFEAYDMLKHPTEDYIYLIDQAGQKLIKFDYLNLEVVSETNLQGTIGYCDIGDNGFGVEIYAPSDDGWIYVYSADDLSETTSINTGLKTASVVVNGLGHVIASVEPSPWWEQPVRTYSRDSGIHIDGNGDHERDRLRMIPGKNEVISITTSVSPVDMEYFKIGSTGEIEIHQDDQYHSDFPLNPRIFRVSDDGTYSITSKDGAVYLANTSMEYKGQLQHGSLQFSDFAFSDDGTIIYAATSNRKSIQIGHYPSLTRDDEILTKGFPIFIIRDGERIISLSKSSENSINTGVEIIQL